MGTLPGQLGRLERDHQQVLGQLRPLQDDQVAWRPGPGQWSLLQIFEHLVVAEHQVLAGLPDFPELREQKRTPRHYLLHGIVLAALALTIRVPTPDPEMEPEGGRTLESLIAQSERNRAWLRRFVCAASPAELRRTVFRHPVSGPLPLTQALLVDHLHFRAHRREIGRNLDLLGA